jgi:phage shock protein C
MICSACGNQMNPGSRFCNHCGGAVMGVPVYPTRSRLVRPRYGRAIAGVCAAFAQEYGWDVALIRILLVVVVFFGCGMPILAYLVAWIAIPNEPYFFPMQPYAQTPPTPSSDPAAATSGSQPAA